MGQGNSLMTRFLSALGKIRSRKSMFEGEESEIGLRLFEVENI